MKLNLTEHRRVYADTGPYKALTEAHLQLLVDGATDTTGLDVTAETMAIICDLGVRYRLDSLVYYRDAATTENVTVYGKQGDVGFDWEEVTMLVASDKVTVDFAATNGPGGPGGAEFNAEYAHFEHASAQFASVADSTVFDVSAMTIECWIRPDDLSAQRSILGKLGLSNGTYSFWLRTVGTTDLQVAFSTDGTSTSQFVAQAHGVTLVDTWHHIAVTWDGSNGDTIIYVDGVALAAAVTLGVGTLHNGATPFAVGQLGGWDQNNEYMDGGISEVRIWGVVRTPTEVQDNMFRVLSGNEAGILAVYHLDNNFDDSGPNDLHLTAVNGPTFTTNIPWGPIVGHFEQLKIIHTVTTGTATAYELEIWADEEHVLFGQEGEATIFSIDSGTETLYTETIPIYNPEVVSAEFFCLIDPDTTHPQKLSLAASPLGTFYDLYETGISIPASVSWASGSLQNVVEVSNTLTLVTGTYGVYYTPVIDIDTVSGRRLFWQATVTGTTRVDDPSRDDSVSTVGVRFSDTVPTDGGWTTGQLSVDTNWSVISGTLPFEVYDNNHILNLKYKRYFQAKVELTAVIDGDTPFLEKIGIEQAIKVTVPPQTYQEVYVKSNSSEHVSGSTTGIVVWSPENRNIGQ